MTRMTDDMTDALERDDKRRQYEEGRLSTTVLGLMFTPLCGIGLPFLILGILMYIFPKPKF